VRNGVAAGVMWLLWAGACCVLYICGIGEREMMVHHFADGVAVQFMRFLFATDLDRVW